LKKNHIYLISILIVIVLILLTFVLQDNGAKLVYINYEQYENLLKKDNPQIIYVSNNKCDGCEEQTPILQYLCSFYNIKINALTLDSLNDQEISKLALSIDPEATTITAPSVLIIQNGNVVDSLIGYHDTKDVSDFLKENRIVNGLVHISTSDYLELMFDTEVSLVYVGKDSCEACVEFEPVLTELLKEHNVVGYYLDADEMTTEEKHAYMASFETLNDGIYTPHLLFVKDGELLADLIGIVKEETILGVLKSQGMIE